MHKVCVVCVWGGVMMVLLVECARVCVYALGMGCVCTMVVSCVYGFVYDTVRAQKQHNSKPHTTTPYLHPRTHL